MLFGCVGPRGEAAFTSQCSSLELKLAMKQGLRLLVLS